MATTSAPMSTIHSATARPSDLADGSVECANVAWQPLAVVLFSESLCVIVGSVLIALRRRLEFLYPLRTVGGRGEDRTRLFLQDVTNL